MPLSSQKYAANRFLWHEQSLQVRLTNVLVDPRCQHQLYNKALLAATRIYAYMLMV